MRRSWELCFIALNSLRRTPLRVALTAMGISIATGAIVSMVGFALGVQARIEEPFQKLELLNRIDVTPAPRAGKDGAGTETGRNSVPLNQATLDSIAALPGVALAYPEQSRGVEIVDREKHVKATAAGLPVGASELLFVRESMLAGQFCAGPGEIVVGKSLAKKLGFVRPEDAVGHALVLFVRGLLPGDKPGLRAESRHLDVRISGVWDAPGGQHGFTNDGLVLPLEVIQELPGVNVESALERWFASDEERKGEFNRVVVRVRRPGHLFAVEDRIQKMGLSTHTLLGQLKQMRTAFVLMDLLLTAVGTVALVVAGLGIINTQLMAVLERYREIGTYRALGASDGDICLLFLAEAALVGLLGGAGGLLLGRFVSWVLEHVVNAVARSYEVDEPVMVFSFPFGLLGGAVLFALLVSLFSGVYPAIRAARVDPVAALRSE